MRRKSPRHFIRKGHGAGKGRPHVEQPPADELPAPIPAPARPAPRRQASGKFVPGAGTTALARAGGLARAQSVQLGRLLGLAKLDASHSYAPYSRLARDLRDQHLADLAEHVGGGRVGAGVASIVSSAALQLAASRFLADKGALECDPGLLMQSSKLASESKQLLLAAHSLAALEAQARIEAEQHSDTIRVTIAAEETNGTKTDPSEADPSEAEDS